jgi:hypothetical protein
VLLLVRGIVALGSIVTTASTVPLVLDCGNGFAKIVGYVVVDAIAVHFAWVQRHGRGPPHDTGGGCLTTTKSYHHHHYRQVLLTAGATRRNGPVIVWPIASMEKGRHGRRFVRCVWLIGQSGPFGSSVLLGQ